MKIPFSKYHGTGNDFILIDNRKQKIRVYDKKTIEELCHRRLGIGADGLILLVKKKGFDFGMIYFNSDGNEGSLCGNGGRCITVFARKLGIIKSEARFVAVDGEHKSEIISDRKRINESIVRLKMNDAKVVKFGDSNYFINSGSPHYVRIVENLNMIDVLADGRKIRTSKPYGKAGTNVDFVMKVKSGIRMRVYERGVEDETFSSGTGAVASSLAASHAGLISDRNFCSVQTKGGLLKVYFKRNENAFNNIWLEGPAVHSFEGILDY